MLFIPFTKKLKKKKKKKIQIHKSRIMKQKIGIMILLTAFMLSGYSQSTKAISDVAISRITKSLQSKNASMHKLRIEKCVKQTAALWRSTDGDEATFEIFCTENFVADQGQLKTLFNKLAHNFEQIYGFYNQLSVEMKRPLHLDMGDLLSIDEPFGAWDPFAHITDDFFDNKIAFIITLNFPFYSLEEKQMVGEQWTPGDWGYVRLGDIFTSRVPASLLQKTSETTTAADGYISNYNIYMGKLFDNTGKTRFPEKMKLITHWGLRDELKSNYANKKEGLENQRLIYQVMKRIITQTIPSEVINSDKYTWNPITNKVFDQNLEVKTTPEPSTRYFHLLQNFKSMQAIDQHSPSYPTYISRKFDQEMEIPQSEVEKMFVDFISSPTVKQVAKLIKKRLGRNLEPFDIWYDGFKSRSTISGETLDSKVREKYPNKAALEKDLPEILVKLGFPREKATFICSKIAVDASRGAGHAWESMMKSDVAHLRTRIGENGMDYKGYNIAVHEFGHNVEQTISLHDVDNYFIKGVPNTSFTEALAFVFQKRDLQLLGITDPTPNQRELVTLDIFWGSYEIMGVSLVDMNVWKWLYANPNATPEQLKETVNRIAIEVWNKYYAPVFGISDQPIFAVYSHMIDAPLYLSAYPIGQLIEYQLENYFEGKNFGNEVMRIYALGKLAPQVWMKKAVGEPLSITPLINATDKALKIIK